MQRTHGYNSKIVSQQLAVSLGSYLSFLRLSSLACKMGIARLTSWETHGKAYIDAYTQMHVAECCPLERIETIIWDEKYIEHITAAVEMFSLPT